MSKKNPDYISFSGLKDWNFCPFYYKLTKIDGIDGFVGNEFTIFGSAIHRVCEEVVQGNKTSPPEMFSDFFRGEIKEWQDRNGDDKLDKKLLVEMWDQGKQLAPLILNGLKGTFGNNFKVISVEEELYEDIEKYNLKYKGFVDLLIQTPDGKYHVIDWKSCSWGWDVKKKSDTMLSYQLTFYKNFISKKHNIDPNDIETHFALLKRTAKKDNVEIFSVSCGERKIKNALNMLETAVYNVEKGFFIKNRLNCSKCKFCKSEHCP